MKMIPLTKGAFALVDDLDYELLRHRKWYISGEYAGCWDKGNTLKMHRVIVNPPADKEVDHINGNKLDNRRINLRICTRSQNRANVGPYRNNTSGYRGVTWSKREMKWIAQIRKHYKLEYIGIFADRDEAALAYNRRAIELFGEYARPNQIAA